MVMVMEMVMEMELVMVMVTVMVMAMVRRVLWCVSYSIRVVPACVLHLMYGMCVMCAFALVCVAFLLVAHCPIDDPGA